MAQAQKPDLSFDETDESI